LKLTVRFCLSLRLALICYFLTSDLSECCCIGIKQTFVVGLDLPLLVGVPTRFVHVDSGRVCPSLVRVGYAGSEPATPGAARNGTVPRRNLPLRKSRFKDGCGL